LKPLIVVETEIFEHLDVKPNFINPSCFGEDFAQWLMLRLTLLEQSGFIFSQPIQEDYGWGFWIRKGKNSFWVAISYVGDGPQEGPVQWVISVDPDSDPNILRRMFRRVDTEILDRLRKSIVDVVTSTPQIKIVDAPQYG
jgi:hypothetical protein